MANRLTAALKSIGRRPYGAMAPGAGNIRFEGPEEDVDILAAGTRALREQAWRFVHDSYVSKGYMESCPSKIRVQLQDALPEATTFLAREGATGRALATLTVYPDGALGLPLDAIYRREIAGLRAAGRKPCEIAKLVADIDARSGRKILLNLFRLAYLTARRLEACTDLVVTVNPRHESYYRRLMMFERIGEVKPYGSVHGAPAVLLRLDLEEAERRYLERSAAGSQGAGFYGFFLNDEAEELLDWLRRERLPMTADEFRHFFVRRTRLLESAPERDRMLLESCYCAGRSDLRFLPDATDGMGAAAGPLLAAPVPARN